MKLVKILLFLLSLLCYFPALSFSSEFLVGEKMVYKLSGVVQEWRIKGNLGSLEIEILDLTNMNGRSYYHCRAVARSSFLVRSRYYLNDIYESWIDTQTFKSVHIEKKIHEGSFQDEIRMKIHPASLKAKEWSKKYPSGKDILVPQDSYDILGFLYYLRSVKKQKSFDFTIYDSDFSKTFHFSVRDGGLAKVKPLLKKKLGFKPKKKKKFRIVSFKEKKFFGLSINVAADAKFIPVSIDVFTLKTGNVHLSGNVRLVRYVAGRKTKSHQKYGSSKNSFPRD